MASPATPAIIVAAALQQVFEVGMEIARGAPPERRVYLEERLRRLQSLRVELLAWAEEARGPA